MEICSNICNVCKQYVRGLFFCLALFVASGGYPLCAEPGATETSCEQPYLFLTYERPAVTEEGYWEYPLRIAYTASSSDRVLNSFNTIEVYCSFGEKTTQGEIRWYYLGCDDAGQIRLRLYGRKWCTVVVCAKAEDATYYAKTSFFADGDDATQEVVCAYEQVAAVPPLFLVTAAREDVHEYFTSRRPLGFPIRLRVHDDVGAGQVSTLAVARTGVHIATVFADRYNEFVYMPGAALFEFGKDATEVQVVACKEDVQGVRVSTNTIVFSLRPFHRKEHVSLGLGIFSFSVIMMILFVRRKRSQS